ncbi:MAG: TolC family protein, partial [Tannerellaceae bacterium]|nr:TolC family protein [Tannerellaceae bacterium]
MMKTSILLIMLGLAGMFPLFAQENRVTELSLRECVQAAVERNIHTQAARIEHEKSGHKVSETRAALLPKISASGSFQDYLKKPVTIFSGDMVGQPGNLVVEIGTQYTTGVSVGVNQALYNQTALTALRLSKTMESLSALGVEKASEELAVEVSKLYFLSLTTARQKTLEEENIARIRRLSDITQTLTDHGMAKQVDYERISVSLENLRTRLSNTEASLEQQLNMI